MAGLTHELAQKLRRAFAWIFAIGSLSVVGVGALGGWALGRQLGRRVRNVEMAATRVMNGKLSERLPIAGENDDIDRLSLTVNQMLDRIEELMASLREVSDNIAHDLRTPLHRLRVRAENALLMQTTDDGLRDALAQTIDDADDLMRTFNAMLLVARLEAGQAVVADD
ncbi:MAG: histidine kinase dimerization/phospho-acceptor domain-containing protein, partial [Pseudomonadota bacterium]